jgi:hypothetical protein
MFHLHNGHILFPRTQSVVTKLIIKVLSKWLFDSRYKTHFNFTLVANIEILEKILSPNNLSPNPRICYLICNDMWYAFLYSHFNLLLWIYWYVSWIYNYICNQCLSPLNLCVRILLRCIIVYYLIYQYCTGQISVYFCSNISCSFGHWRRSLKISH